MNLHITLRYALADIGAPSPLDTVHLYTPESDSPTELIDRLPSGLILAFVLRE